VLAPADEHAHVAASRPPVAVAVRGLSRSFGATRALQDVDLDIRAGTVHAFVGENGAGKSTCLGIIAGRIAPSDGDVQVFGESFNYGDPRAAMRLGVAAVYQELTIIPRLSPQVNAFLAAPPTRRGLISTRAMRRRYEEICAQLGIPASPDVPAGDLAVGAQQLIEIVRGVNAAARVLLLDEPTAALDSEATAGIEALVRALAGRGLAVLMITHDLAQAERVASRSVRLERGRIVE
jgi:ABC-type sugar transport system ATPase subunit